MSSENDSQLEQQRLEGGADDGAAAPKKEAPPDPRMLAMEQITVHREGMDEQQPADTATQVAQQTAAEPVVLTDMDRTMVKVKVDGVESMVSVADVVARFQKNEAADKRLAEAARLRAEAEAMAQQQKPPATVDAATGGGQTQHQSPPQGDDKGQTVKDFLQSLFEGDEEKAAERLQALLSVGGRADSSTPIDPGALAAQLTPAIRQQLQNDSALDTFLETNQAIANDPYLTQMTVGFLDEELKGGKAYPEALAEAGRRTSGWMASKGIPITTNEPRPTTTRDDKLARKGQMDDIRPASTSAASTVAAPQSPSQVIDEMRKARGLPV